MNQNDTCSCLTAGSLKSASKKSERAPEDADKPETKSAVTEGNVVAQEPPGEAEPRAAEPDVISGSEKGSKKSGSRRHSKSSSGGSHKSSKSGSRKSDRASENATKPDVKSVATGDFVEDEGPQATITTDLCSCTTAGTARKSTAKSGSRKSDRAPDDATKPDTRSIMTGDIVVVEEAPVEMAQEPGAESVSTVSQEAQEAEPVKGSQKSSRSGSRKTPTVPEDATKPDVTGDYVEDGGSQPTINTDLCSCTTADTARKSTAKSGSRRLDRVPEDATKPDTRSIMTGDIVVVEEAPVATAQEPGAESVSTVPQEAQEADPTKGSQKSSRSGSRKTPTVPEDATKPDVKSAITGDFAEDEAPQSTVTSDLCSCTTAGTARKSTAKSGSRKSDRAPDDATKPDTRSIMTGDIVVVEETPVEAVQEPGVESVSSVSQEAQEVEPAGGSTKGSVSGGSKKSDQAPKTRTGDAVEADAAQAEQPPPQTALSGGFIPQPSIGSEKKSSEKSSRKSDRAPEDVTKLDVQPTPVGDYVKDVPQQPTAWGPDTCSCITSGSRKSSLKSASRKPDAAKPDAKSLTTGDVVVIDETPPKAEQESSVVQDSTVPQEPQKAEPADGSVSGRSKKSDQAPKDRTGDAVEADAAQADQPPPEAAPQPSIASEKSGGRKSSIKSSSTKSRSAVDVDAGKVDQPPPETAPRPWMRTYPSGSEKSGMVCYIDLATSEDDMDEVVSSAAETLADCSCITAGGSVKGSVKSGVTKSDRISEIPPGDAVVVEKLPAEQQEVQPADAVADKLEGDAPQEPDATVGSVAASKEPQEPDATAGSVKSGSTASSKEPQEPDATAGSVKGGSTKSGGYPEGPQGPKQGGSIESGSKKTESVDADEVTGDFEGQPRKIPDSLDAEPPQEPPPQGILDPHCDPDNPKMLNYDMIRVARKNISGAVVKTPLTRSKLSDLYGMNIYLKSEFLQYTGSFKERGARHALMSMPEEQKQAGAVSASAGNHALALCYHGQQLDIPVTVVMPITAPIMKIQNCKSFGANVIVQGENLSEAKTIAQSLAAEKGALYINGYDHIDILAGQGTLGIEILEQLPTATAVIVPVGGGGLIAGVAVAIKNLKPCTKVIGVESENCPSFSKSLKAGKPVQTTTLPTVADGLAVSLPGYNSVYTSKTYVDKMIVVKEDDISVAILRLIEKEKFVVEGAGATAIAAIASGQLNEYKGKNVVAILSGGNIDSTILGRVLERGLAADGRYLKFYVTVSDRPGGVADLIKLISSVGVSIKYVTQERSFLIVDVYSVMVKVVCETRDFDHALQLKSLLEEHYDSVDMVHVDFPPSTVGGKEDL